MSECDLEASIMRIPWHTGSGCAITNVFTGREVASLKLLCVYLLGEIEGNYELMSSLLVYTVRVANSSPPADMARAFCNESLGVQICVHIILWTTVLDSLICHVLMLLKIHRIV